MLVALGREAAAFAAAARRGDFFCERTGLVLVFLAGIGMRTENIAHRRAKFLAYSTRLTT
jgi:hypothetical protein